jgi:hypothetical protein
VVRLYQLVFTGAATRVLDIEDLLQMLDQSRADNMKHNVTGVLLYLSGGFLQVLEGPKGDILRLYELIRNDDRNKDVDPINVGPIEEREFNGWSMGFAVPSLDRVQDVKGFSVVQSSDDFDQVGVEDGAVPVIGPTVDLFKRFYDRSLAQSGGEFKDDLCLFVNY